MKRRNHRLYFRLGIAITLLLCCVTGPAGAAAVFARFMVEQPEHGQLQLTIGGYSHNDPWQFPAGTLNVAAGSWSDWFDAGKWPLHSRLDRSGGIAEWPAMRVTVAAKGVSNPLHGCSLKVQLADKPSEDAVVHSFTEKSESNTIAFLLPTPLREHAKEFETGSQMTARHLQWARQATGERPVQLKNFTFVTALWGHYDPALARGVELRFEKTATGIKLHLPLEWTDLVVLE